MWKYVGNTILEDSRAFRTKLVDKVQRDLLVARVRKEVSEWTERTPRSYYRWCGVHQVGEDHMP